ncbi:hypothetical protein ACFWP5_08795 [Streptomyces sp. NPDC058469]|uniref:hypothetical protein n=1 Tax=Streptomyces sp. NPDC058469 TaxID=3346514 RepID=UPI003657DA06
MKQIIKNYSFSASGKTVTLTDFGTIRLDRLQLIIDTTTNKILYNFADSTVTTATVATNVITLAALQGGEADTDKLQIIYDVVSGDPVYDGGQRTMANSAPVAIASDQGAVPISAASLPIPTGAATSANQATGNASLSSIDGKIVAPKTDDYDTGAGTDTVQSIGIALPGAGGHVVGGTASNPVRTDTTGTTTQPVSGSVTANAGTNLNTSALALESGGNLAAIAGAVKAEDAAHSSGDAGIQVLTKRTDTAASSAGTDGDYASLNTDNTGRLWTRIGATDSLTPGTAATNLGKAEDAAHTSGDVGTMALAVRESTPTDLSAGNTDGDYEPLQVGRDGGLWVAGIAAPKGGWTPATGSIGATKTDIGTANTAGQVGGWYIYNPNASVAYVQFFNAQASAVTLGTTAPVYSLPLPAGAAANVGPGMVGINHSTAISIAVTTTRAGSTGPVSTVDYNLWYKQ